MQLVKKLGEWQPEAGIQMILGYGFIGDLTARNHSIQDVIPIDTVILQSPGIELTDGTGLTTEAAIGITPVVPDLIEPAIDFCFNQIIIVT